MAESDSRARQLAENVFKIPDHVRHADVVAGDLVDRAILGALQHGLKSFDQVEDGDVQAGVLVFGQKLIDLRIRPRGLFHQPLLLEHLGGVFEALVFEQAVDQFLARVVFA